MNLPSEDVPTRKMDTGRPKNRAGGSFSQPLYEEKMKYGNTIETVKHVAKVGIFFWIVLFAIFAITAYSNGKLSNPSEILYVVWYPLIIASILPFMVWITTLLNVVIDDKTISLLVFYKLKYNQQSIEKIEQIGTSPYLFRIK